VNVISRQQIAYNTYMYVNTIASMLEISKKTVVMVTMVINAKNPDYDIQSKV
jgi:hypothetical protein